MVTQLLLGDGIPEDVSLQVSEMVGEAVDRALRTLMVNGGGTPQQPTGYVMPARTAQEVKLAPAASQGQVSGAAPGQMEAMEQVAGDDIMELARASKKSSIADPASQGEAPPPQGPTKGEGVAWIL
jgi:hypothetical protein